MMMMQYVKLDDSVGVDLGVWDVTLTCSYGHSVQFILACLEAPSSDEEPDGVVCQLIVRFRPRAASVGVALGTTLGVDEAEGASHEAVAIAARSLEGRSLQRL